MIYAYGVTLNGPYHEKDGLPCQDAHKIIKVGPNLCIAAVADGLGGAKHSKMAAKIAVDVTVGYCAENITCASTPHDIEQVIRLSFEKAQDSIEAEARAKECEQSEYDTTLSLAVLKGNEMSFGHSGDSGIVVLTEEGLYEKATEQQRDEDGRVFPLFFRDKWVFGTHPKRTASVFLATDGMYETLFPLYIYEEPISIYVALARYFMDNRVLNIDEVGEDAVQERIENFLAGISDTLVNDDKTVVVVVNSSVKTKVQPPEYYATPDWTELKRKWDETWRKRFYPHLYDEEPSQQKEEPGS